MSTPTSLPTNIAAEWAAYLSTHYGVMITPTEVSQAYDAVIRDTPPLMKRVSSPIKGGRSFFPNPDTAVREYMMEWIDKQQGRTVRPRERVIEVTLRFSRDNMREVTTEWDIIETLMDLSSNHYSNSDIVVELKRLLRERRKQLLVR